MSKKNIVLLIVMAAILVTATVFALRIKSSNDYKKTDAAQTLGTKETASYQSLVGTDVSFEDFDGTVRVVNSWATWSPFSRVELKDLDRLAAAYAEQGVNVIAVNRNEDIHRVKRYIEQLGELNSINFLLDGADTFYDRMDGQAMPETLFFNVRGDIIKHARGNLSYEEMEEYVQEALSN